MRRTATSLLARRRLVVAAACGSATSGLAFAYADAAPPNNNDKLPSWLSFLLEKDDGTNKSGSGTQQQQALQRQREMANAPAPSDAGTESFTKGAHAARELCVEIAQRVTPRKNRLSAPRI